MSTAQELKATERDTTLTPRQLRAAGFVPATIYAKGIESRSIQVRAHEFVQFSLQGHKEFTLSGLGTELGVRVQQLQVDSVSRAPLSIEFYQVSPQAAGNTAKAAKAPNAQRAAASQKIKDNAAKPVAEQDASPEEAEAETVTA